MNGLRVNYDDDNEEINIDSSYQLANNLFKDFHIDRHSLLKPEEVPILSLLKVLGKVQDDYRKRILKIEEPCNLTLLVDEGLKMRTSIDGWRSEQVVRILESKAIQQTVNPNQEPNKIDTSNVITRR